MHVPAVRAVQVRRRPRGHLLAGSREQGEGLPAVEDGQQGVVVRFEDGDSTWCNTATATKDSKFDANTGKVRLIMRDPLFSVGVDAARTVTVKVDPGYVEVSTRGHRRRRPRPRPADAVPTAASRASPGTLTAHDQERIDDLSLSYRRRISSGPGDRLADARGDLPGRRDPRRDREGRDRPDCELRPRVLQFPSEVLGPEADLCREHGRRHRRRPREGVRRRRHRRSGACREVRRLPAARGRSRCGVVGAASRRRRVRSSARVVPRGVGRERRLRDDLPWRAPGVEPNYTALRPVLFGG